MTSWSLSLMSHEIIYLIPKHSQATPTFENGCQCDNRIKGYRGAFPLSPFINPLTSPCYRGHSHALLALCRKGIHIVRCELCVFKRFVFFMNFLIVDYFEPCRKCRNEILFCAKIPTIENNFCLTNITRPYYRLIVCSSLLRGS